jgi:UDP-N-acetylglucosamine:LPS N-acetylglucosamine transferase
VSAERSEGEGPRVLIVHSRVGGGHVSAARALGAALEACGARPRLLDVYVECARFPVSRFPSLYAHVARHHPRVWAAFFRASGRRIANPSLTLRPFLARGLAEALSAQPPRLIVSVLPGVNGLLGRLKRRVDARLEVVLTDWAAIHRTWVAQGVDHYTVPSDAARQDLLGYGVVERALEVIGIPVRAPFAAPAPTAARRAAIRAERGLDPRRFTVLVMAGAEGSPRALSNVRALLDLDLDAQVLVVCGRNERLRRRLQGRPGVVALGWRRDVHRLMQAADVLVQNAGGLSFTESLVAGLPAVTYRPIPGHGRANARVLHDAGLAPWARNRAELARHLHTQAAAGRTERRFPDPADLVLGVAVEVAA